MKLKAMFLITLTPFILANLPAYFTMNPADSAPRSLAEVDGQYVIINTSEDNWASFVVIQDNDGLYLENFDLYDSNGTPLYRMESIRIRDTWMADLDNATETGDASKAEFWYRFEDEERQYMVPMQGLMAVIPTYTRNVSASAFRHENLDKFAQGDLYIFGSDEDPFVRLYTDIEIPEGSTVLLVEASAFADGRETVTVSLKTDPLFRGRTERTFGTARNTRQLTGTQMRFAGAVPLAKVMRNEALYLEAICSSSDAALGGARITYVPLALEP
ncbi:MAG: hypothetical protein KDC35_10970 [Acidobacteria bacterium]|nr:hypothetical protein [Acidobacteriota bacterium]